MAPTKAWRTNMPALAQKAVLGAGDDPFRLAELTPDDLKGDGARLADELNAISMLGGRRVVRIAQASNMIAEQIETAIAGQVPGSALLVVEAGDIGSKAELVKVFESADGAGVFACYRDNEAQLGPLIAAHLKAGGYGIARDALAYLAERLGGDRGVTRSELDKLMLYLGEPKREVTLNDAMTCIGDRAAFALDDLIGAAVDGDIADLDRQYTRSLAEVEAIQVLRSAARHFQRLHQVVARMAAGEPFEAAASALRPPLFWTQRDRMQRQARQWSTSPHRPRARAPDRSRSAGDARLRDQGRDRPARADGHRDAGARWASAALAGFVRLTAQARHAEFTPGSNVVCACACSHPDARIFSSAWLKSRMRKRSSFQELDTPPARTNCCIGNRNVSRALGPAGSQIGPGLRRRWLR